ncbi:iron-containing alcohol dehydrogenase family protein [Affinibrenneria salicis]|uniref:Iron-containing alcohol dehydrogenase family protein n=1 Tax=Affinibrenneria salicis TaxID=2590031 RepID=A0A5J5FYK2_9GAMM|nr:iron-containing alcohol dehydrogenase family protein [Affinibrenneria salicis]KAA8999043.1 iron-containing alcohol dehydrogenase family protein [Affinibrenneria salicis]
MVSIQVPQNYLNSDGIINRAGEYVAPLARKVLIISSPRAWQAVSQPLGQSLTGSDIAFSTEFLTGPCTRDAVDAFAAIARRDRAELIIGVGGGRVLDSAKAVGEILGQLPVITIPTIAATCAAWSPISVIYTDAGAHVGPLPLSRLPVWVLVDSQLIARSDVRYLKAGIVDALAKWYEFLPYLVNGDDELALILKSRMAKLALETIKTFGRQALDDNQQQRVTPALRKVIDAVIALAGLANSMRDEQPRIGIAHAIHNSMTRLPQLHHWLHGEKVGFGLAVQSFLQYRHDDNEARKELLTLLRRFDTPLTPQAIGLTAPLESLREIARGVVIAPGIALRLPFSLARESIEAALLATLNLDDFAGDESAAFAQEALI